MTERPRTRAQAATITAREWDYLCAVADGLHMDEVADRYVVSRHAVKSTLERFRHRHGTPTLASAVALAIRSGWIPGAPGLPGDGEPGRSVGDVGAGGR